MNKNTDSLKGKEGETSFETMFHLTQTAFILKMLRIFVVAAFSAEDPATYEEVVLARKASHEATNHEMDMREEGERFKDLQSIFKGELRAKVLGSINYSEL